MRVWVCTVHRDRWARVGAASVQVCVVSCVPGCMQVQVYMRGGLSCLAAFPGWALTPECEQMGLTGPGRDHSCLAARKRPVLGPQKGAGSILTQQRSTSPSVLLPARRPASPSLCCPVCGGGKVAGLFIKSFEMAGGCQPGPRGEAVPSGPDLVTWPLTPLWPFTIPSHRYSCLRGEVPSPASTP